MVLRCPHKPQNPDREISRGCSGPLGLQGWGAFIIQMDGVGRGGGRGREEQSDRHTAWLCGVSGESWGQCICILGYLFVPEPRGMQSQPRAFPALEAPMPHMQHAPLPTMPRPSVQAHS